MGYTATMPPLVQGPHENCWTCWRECLIPEGGRTTAAITPRLPKCAHVDCLLRRLHNANRFGRIICLLQQVWIEERKGFDGFPGGEPVIAGGNSRQSEVAVRIGHRRPEQVRAFAV